MNRSVVTIFLASPGDLNEERSIAKNIVERVNHVFSRQTGYYLDLLGWEDTLPGFSRPQELINKEVDSCDLFIGVLWHRWGQSTGKFSSGFEEEFTRARERKIKTDTPELWLFFKSVDEESLKDPGNQLKRVLKFKKEQGINKELLYKEFTSTEHWSEILREYLSSYILKLVMKAPVFEVQEQSSVLEASKKNHKEIESKVSGEKTSYPSELIDLFEKTATKLRKGKPVEFNIWDGTRLYLQSSAWFSQSHIGEIFGNHEINLTYVKRKVWKLSDSEKQFLFRSSISDKYNHRPGWFWVRDLPIKRLDALLTSLSFYDENEEVRRGAFRLLVDSGAELKKSFIEKALYGNDKEIILDAIRLLRNSKTKNYSLLDPLLDNNDSKIKEAALITRVELLYLIKPKKAFSDMIEKGSKIPELIKKKMEKGDFNIDKELLYRTLEKAETSVRISTAQFLRKKNLLSKNKCFELLKDPDANVRREGILTLIDLGHDIDMGFVKSIFSNQKKQEKNIWSSKLYPPRVDPDDFLPLLLQRKKADDLLSCIDFYNFDSYIPYRILALDHFSKIEHRIRPDLDKNFENLKNESERRLREKQGDERAESLIKSLNPDLIKFIKARFASAALEGLAKNGNEDDIKYARRYIGKNHPRIANNAALKILFKYGNSSDVKKILEIASHEFDENKKLALETAYRLSKNKAAFLNKLIKDDDSDQSKIAANLLARSTSTKKIKLAKKLLSFKTDKRRLEGLAILCKKYSLLQLEALLEEYINKKSYYYNVVSWIDKGIYSKGRYRSFFHNELSRVIHD